MAKLTVDAVRGYVLEEILAKLLSDNGYRLLVSEDQDPDVLKRGGHGLLVRGRGTDHQADVLGEFTLPIPFSLPLRIFVEAKYRGITTKSGLGDVRNAHGVIHDVNEQYATATVGTRTVPMRRHHYRYTLFSASGFSRPAQQYAMAHQISLVDLSGPAFAGLRAAADQTARQVHRLAGQAGVVPFARGQMRTALRLALGTWTEDERDFVFSMMNVHEAEAPEAEAAEERAAEAKERSRAQSEPRPFPSGPLAHIAGNLADGLRDNLLLGFPSAPFVLVLRPDDPAALSAYVARHGPDVEVAIEFATRRDVTGDWVIVPADGSRSFTLRFGLPTLLEDWILSDAGAAALRARDVKADLLSSIAIFLDGRLIRLLFRPRPRG